MSEEKREQSKKLPPVVSGPSTIMTPEQFSKWMSYTTSTEFLTRERIELLRRMSENLARDPSLLRHIERMFADYGEEIYRVSPSDAELAKVGFGWTGDGPGPAALPPPAAAAAALAPPAAAMAAAHAPGE
jgi:hypothetical protein